MQGFEKLELCLLVRKTQSGHMQGFEKLELWTLRLSLRSIVSLASVVDQTPGLLREASHLLLEKVIVLASCSMIEVLSDFHPMRAGNKDVVGTNQLHSHKKTRPLSFSAKR